MIITRTPYRISFFGGGTDYPAWYRREGGAVLSTTIDKYCYITCRVLPPFFAARHRIVWSHIETVSTISEILHPAVRAGLRYLGFDDSTGIELHHQGDLPARSGIGSSSSFSVGLIKALLALRGTTIDQHTLALSAIEFEQDIMKEAVGAQDQIAAAYGGLNHIRFNRDGGIEVLPLSIAPSQLVELESRLLLFFTGTSRLSSEIARELISTLEKRESQLKAMRRLVDRATTILESVGDLDAFGRLLHENWMLKRELGDRISSPSVDKIYRSALEHGALGGKLLGAGNSGFMIFYVPPESQSGVIEALGTCLHVPFKFESEGCRLIYKESPNGSAEPEPAGSRSSTHGRNQ